MNNPAFSRHILITVISSVSLGILSGMLKGAERGVMIALLDVAVFSVVWLLFSKHIIYEYENDHSDRPYF